MDGKLNKINSDFKKHFTQGGSAYTENLNGYFRKADVTFPVPYKSGTIPNVCGTTFNYGNTYIDAGLSTLVKNITNTGFTAYVADPGGEIASMGYTVQWISVGEID